MSAQSALAHSTEALDWSLEEEDAPQGAACEYVIKMHGQLTEISNYEKFLRSQRDELWFLLERLEGDSKEGK